MDAPEEGTVVEWNAQSGSEYGEVRDTIGEGESYEEEIDGDQKVTGPAALIEHYERGDDGEFESTGTTVAHQLDTLAEHDSFPDES